MLASVANTSKLHKKKRKRKESGHVEVGHMANVSNHKTKKGEQIIGTQLWMGLWACWRIKPHTYYFY